MVVVLLVVAVVVVAGAALFMGLVRFASDRSLAPGATAGLVVAGLAGVVALAVVVGVLGIGARTRSADEGPAATRVADNTGPPPTTAPPTSPTTVTVDRAAAPAQLGPTVVIAAGEATPNGFPRLVPSVGDLVPGTVLTVGVRGFEPFASATASQCSGRGRCGNTVPVQFDEHGRARFQYLVTDDFGAGAATGGCGASAAPCTVVVADRESGRRATLATLFHDVLPPPARVRIEPRTGIEQREAVTVTATGLPRGGAPAHVRLCAPHAGAGVVRDEHCSRPLATIAPSEPQASARVTLPIGPVGDGRECGPRHRCGVVLTSATGRLLAPVAPVGFAAPPRPARDTLRLVVGLAVAAALTVLALVVIRLTNWSPPGEAAAPEIDNADYADLDAMVAALPPDPEDDDAKRKPGGGHPRAGDARQYS